MKLLRKLFGLNSTSKKIKRQVKGDGYVYTEFEYEPEIPEFQGDYAKTIFLYANNLNIYYPYFSFIKM
jgi:hypothetical protein